MTRLARWSSIGVAQEDDPLAQQAGVDVVGALPPAGGLDDHGDEHAWTPWFQR